MTRAPTWTTPIWQTARRIVPNRALRHQVARTSAKCRHRPSMMPRSKPTQSPSPPLRPDQLSLETASIEPSLPNHFRRQIATRRARQRNHQRPLRGTRFHRRRETSLRRDRVQHRSCRHKRPRFRPVNPRRALQGDSHRQTARGLHREVQFLHASKPQMVASDLRAKSTISLERPEEVKSFQSPSLPDWSRTLVSKHFLFGVYRFPIFSASPYSAPV